MSSLHEIVPAMPVQSGIQLTPSTSITQAYIDHVDNLFRSERATLENQFNALTLIKNASVASGIITAQGTDAKTDLTNDQLRGSIVAYHEQTAQLRRGYDQISKSSRPKTEQDSRKLNDSRVAWQTTILGVSMNAASAIKYACEVNPGYRETLEGTQATVFKKAPKSKSPWDKEESEKTDLYTQSTKDADPFATAWKRKPAVSSQANTELTKYGGSAAEST